MYSSSGLAFASVHSLHLAAITCPVLSFRAMVRGETSVSHIAPGCPYACRDLCLYIYPCHAVGESCICEPRCPMLPMSYTGICDGPHP